MFTIIISEKGGAERKESFDKNEINVGRVQGNDLMLPKGNVSKHHARLLYRDGRFIVTDLKSTNGTYVNGRKIAQATIVREGDKIYIGDFVLKLDTGVVSQGPPDPEAYRSQSQEPPRLGAGASQQAQAIQPVPVHMAGQQQQMVQPTAQMPQMPPQMPPMPMPPQVSPGQMAPGMPAQMPPLPQPIAQGGPVPPPTMSPRAGNDGQYALDRDPDESQNNAAQNNAGALPRMPPAPRVPNVPSNARVGNSTAVLQNRPATQQQYVQPPVIAPPAASPGPTPGPAPQTPGPPPQMAQARSPQTASMPPRPLPRETPAQAGRRLALITLVDRVADVVELAPLKKSPTVDEALTQQIDRSVREQAKAMRDEGEAPEGIDLELLVRDALREFVGLGPIGPLLEDDDVSEIHATRHDYVLAVRGGAPVLADASFTSEEALYRAVTRLAHQSGDPWRANEVVVQRRLSRGAQMVAILPPAAMGCVLVIRKRRRIESSLEEFVRSGAMSRPMATFLEHCLTARTNVLVAGPSAVVTPMLSALASAGPPGDRIAVLQDTEELGVAQAHAVALALPDHDARGEDAVRAAAALRGDRLVVATLAGGIVAATLEVIGEGAEGVIAGVYAPSLRHATARLVAQLAMVRPGIGVETAREALGESFDVAVEVAKLPDGRLRVTRIAELFAGDEKGVGSRDLFALEGGGASGEGAFVASGVVPRLVNDFAARGVKIDQNLFKRTVGRNN